MLLNERRPADRKYSRKPVRYEVVEYPVMVRDVWGSELIPETRIHDAKALTRRCYRCDN